MKKATILLTIFLWALSSSMLLAQDRELLQVFVGNEGSFNSGNATITQFQVNTEQVTDGVFAAANGVGIGDVVQSLSWIDGEIYIVVNNSRKIVRVDPDTFQQTGQISLGEGASPREIVKVKEGEAYVSDLYSRSVLKIDLNTLTDLGSPIAVGQNPEQMLLHNGFVYVANNGFGADSTIFKIDVSSHSVIDTITVARGPARMIMDSKETLWVVCTGYAGDFDENFQVIPGTARPGGVFGIDSETGEVTMQLEIESAGSDLAMNKSETELYINAGGIRTVDIINTTIATEAFIAGNFYSFDFDTESGTFFGADAKSFSSAGEVRYYDQEGSLEGNFPTGIIPGSFLLVYDQMTTTSTEISSNVENFRLNQNYPNPFNPSTNISFQIPQSGQVLLEVFTVSGQKVATLINQKMNAGEHRVTFDASGISTGLYLYRLTAGSTIITKKMTVIK
jgi:hypothetical protein